MPLRPSLLAALLVVPALAVSACGGSDSDAAAKPSTSASASTSASTSSSPSSTASDAPVTVKDSDAGITVKGAFGATPTLTIPTGKAPTALSRKVLTVGTGKAVAKGQVLVANYVGQTWDPKAGKPNVFDSSFAKGQPAGFPIGVGGVIKGWDATLTGATVGSRVLLSIPPALGYGAAKSTTNELAGQTLVFVVDVIGQVSPTAAASGTAAPTPAATFPKVASTPGKQPTITRVAGVKAPTAPVSALLVKGDGAPIDTKKALALQIVQTDVATGKQTQKTWGQAVQLVPASQVLLIARSLTGQNVGSRAVAVVPAQATAGTPATVLVIDVVAQF